MIDPVVSKAPLADGFHPVAPGKLVAVVTVLEMTVPPEPRPARREPSWVLRHVLRPDPAWYRALYRRVGEDWLWFSRLMLRDEELAAIIQHPDVVVFSLDVEGSPEGLLELDFRKAGECEIVFLGVTARMVGSGAGRLLMNRAVERAWASPIERLWVHTCDLDHPGALNFYVRSGFQPVQQWVEVMTDPRVSGVLSPHAAPQVPLIR